MNIYRISQRKNNDYDTYDSAIVAAETEEEARQIHPESEWKFKNESLWNDSPYGTWCAKPEDVEVEYLGKADDKIEKGIILTSYNAG